MSEEQTIPKTHHEALDVFIHSKVGFPGAWSEEKVQTLLDLWEDVLSRPRSRRYSVSKRICKRLLGKEEFKEFNKDDVFRQMSLLSKEYYSYLGFQMMGVEMARPACVDQLDRIFSKAKVKPLRQTGSRPRRNTEPTKQSEISEDSDHSRSQSVTYGEKEPKADPTKADDALSKTRRGRFPKMNIQRLIRTMVSQQTAMMEQVQKLFSSLEESNSKTAALLEDLVLFQKTKHSTVGEN
ncbi:uncharacterized protein [Parasteatoda tepidariorum]|nr:uncharacterized protein LOC107441905 [Parasteatoda tepidariorum]